ncbi:MAG: tyrosine-type recombinase/integrase [Pedobacter sp.]
MDQNYILKQAASEKKGLEISQILQGYWAKNTWPLKEIPIGTPPKVDLEVRFNCKIEQINQELKVVHYLGIKEGRFGTDVIQFGVHIYIKIIDSNITGISSLMEKSLKFWETLLTTYLKENGYKFPVKKGYFSKSDGCITERKMTKHFLVCRFAVLYKILEDFYDDRDEWSKDKVCPIKTGLDVPAGNSPTPLNFTGISQGWLRKAAKDVWKDWSLTNDYLYLKSCITDINRFSKFIGDKQPKVDSPEKITREVIEQFIRYLKNWKITRGRNKGGVLEDSSIAKNLSIVRNILESEAAIDDHGFPDERLIWNEDIPYVARGVGKHSGYISEFVYEQIIRHMEILKEPWRTTLAIIDETGARFGEICGLERTCLKQDSDGDWHMSRYLRKQKTWHVVPITLELAKCISVQAKRVVDTHGVGCTLLFPNEQGQPYHRSSFIAHYHEWAVANEIRNEEGSIWVPSPHRYRHQVPTRMINNNVALHIVMRYMGYNSDTMLDTYAHLFDETAKREFEAFVAQSTSEVIGKVADEIMSLTNLDTKWLRRNIMTQILPNGVCTLPVLAGDCPHADACLFCYEFFKTTRVFLPVHKKHLAENEELEKIAYYNGWEEQQTKANKKIDRLKEIITGLESSSAI